jgi:nitrite reductase (NADH) small subunit
VREATVPRYVAVCRVDEVVEGRGGPFEVDGLRVAVFRVAGEFHALLGRCPHANGSLGLGWVEEGEAVCPLHRWRFRLATGRCTTVRGVSVHRFRCEVRGEQVWVEV